MASLKLDENLPAEATELLQGAGHDAMSVWDQSLEGHSDDSIASVCQSEERAIVTFDLDFADIRAYPPEDYFGIVVLRLHQQREIGRGGIGVVYEAIQISLGRRVAL